MVLEHVWPTHLLLLQALDFALFERLDETVLGRQVDDLGIRVSEVELVEQVVQTRHLAFVRPRDEFARPALALQVQLKLLRHGGGEDERSHVGSHRQRVCIRARRNDIVKVVDVGVLALCPEEAGAAGSAWEKKLAARRELKGGELTCCDASI
jgi:hypothetical protein